MGKTTKLLIVLLVLTLCMSCYLCYKYHTYKQIGKEWHRRYIYAHNLSNRADSLSKVLSPYDILVISGDAERASFVCNSRYYSGRRDRDFYVKNDSAISDRDYLFYCYILAIRDKSLSDAINFSSVYLLHMNHDTMSYDTAMLHVVSNLLEQTLSASSESADIDDKLLAAMRLSEIYDGTYGKCMKDTALSNHYQKLVDKYTEQKLEQYVKTNQ